MSNIMMIIGLLGGLGLFLYGMTTMGDGLEKMAGEKLQTIIRSLTGNIFSSVLVGVVVTAVIQSSSATTVIVVGFVNAGIMTLPQAVGVIMGANIGTTVTAQILRLGDLESSLWFLELLKPASLSAIAIFIGFLLFMIAKRQKIKQLGTILLGFGVLFAGMEMMSSSVQSLQDVPWFKNIFLACENPVTGILAGTLVTALIQSSSASIGILQAVASTGAITYASAIPIILGQNIGTTVTALISSIGASKNAKKAAMIHVYFNLIGSIIFIIIVYVLQYTIGLPFWNDTVNMGGIANFHTFFNLTNTILMLPFAKGLIFFANKTIGDSNSVIEEPKYNLDKRFLTAPNVAVAQCVQEAMEMGKLALENLRYSQKMLIEQDSTYLQPLIDNEDALDKMEINLSDYLSLITDRDITEKESKIVSSLFHIVIDIERIGDHCINISEAAKSLMDKKKTLSSDAKEELSAMFDAVAEILGLSLKSYGENDLALAKRVEPYEDVIDKFNDTLKNKHISRLKSKKCAVRVGVVYLEVINDLERIADHCSNIAFDVFKQHDEKDEFDPHAYVRTVSRSTDEEYNTYYKEFKNKYYKIIQ